MTLPAAGPALPPAGEFTAELRGADRRFQLAVQAERPILLGRGCGTDPENVDLGGLPNARTVSRRHALLVPVGGRWSLEALEGAANATRLNGAAVAPGAAVPVSSGDRIQLGLVELVLQSFVPAPADVVGLDLEITEIEALPGEQTQVLLTLTNHTGRVERFQVEVVGLPESWYRIYLPDSNVTTPAVFLLHTPPGAPPLPEAQQRLRLILQPPRAAAVRAGVYPFQVVASTTGEPRQRGFAVGSLTVRPFEQLDLLVDPDELWGASAWYRVEVHNAGNAPAPVELRAAGEGLSFTWQEGEGEGDLVVANGERASILLQAAPRRRHWQGVDFRYNFWVAARSGIIEPPPQRAQLVVPPKVPAWLQAFWGTFYGLLAPILLLILILVFAYLFLRPPDIMNIKAEVHGQNAALSVRVDRSCAIPQVEPAGTVQLNNARGAARDDCGFLGTFVESLPGNARSAVWEGQVALRKDPVPLVVSAKNLLGISTSRNVDIPAATVPLIVSFRAEPQRLRQETEAVQLSWQTQGADAVKLLRLEGGPGESRVARDLNISIGQVSGTATDTVRLGTTDYLLLAAIAETDDEPTRESLLRIHLQCRAGNEVFDQCVARKSALALAERRFAHCKPRLLNKEPCDLPNVVMGVVRVVVEKPVVAAFTASVPVINPSGELGLRWDVQNASGLELETRETVAQPPNPAGCRANRKTVTPLELQLNQAVVAPACDTEYVLRATSAGGVVEQSVKVKVAPIEIVGFEAQPASVARGEPVTLAWNVVGGAWVELEPGGVLAPGETSRTVRPETTTQYTLTVYGPNRSGQPATRQVTVQVGLPPAKVDFFQAVTPVIAKGDAAQLVFSVQHARHVRLAGSDGSVVLDEALATPALQRTVAVTPQQNTVYTLTVRNESSQVALAVTITVQPAAAPAAAASPTPPVPPAQQRAAPPQ